MGLDRTGAHVQEIKGAVIDASNAIVEVANSVKEQGNSSTLITKLLFYKKQQIQITYYVITLFAALVAITFTYSGFDQSLIFRVLAIVIAVAGAFLVGYYDSTIRKLEEELEQNNVDHIATTVTTVLQMIVMVAGVILVLGYLGSK